MHHDLYFEDFKIGDIFTTTGKTLSEGEMLDFALRYDPQPFHIDKEAASKSMFGGLIAGGMQTLAIAMGQFFRLNLWASNGLPSPGIDHLRWLQPVRPDDTLHTVNEVIALTPSRSKADQGMVRIMHKAINQNGEVVLTVDCMHRLRRRPPGEEAS